MAESSKELLRDRDMDCESAKPASKKKKTKFTRCQDFWKIQVDMPVSLRVNKTWLFA